MICVNCSRTSTSGAYCASCLGGANALLRGAPVEAPQEEQKKELSENRLTPLATTSDPPTTLSIPAGVAVGGLPEACPSYAELTGGVRKVHFKLLGHEPLEVLQIGCEICRPDPEGVIWRFTTDLVVPGRVEMKFAPLFRGSSRLDYLDDAVETAGFPDFAEAAKFETQYLSSSVPSRAIWRSGTEWLRIARVIFSEAGREHHRLALQHASNDGKITEACRQRPLWYRWELITGKLDGEHRCVEAGLTLSSLSARFMAHAAQKHYRSQL